MDPRLLRLYEDELAYLREMGAEFARESPKIAGRLGMEGLEVTDPYVERLMEGFAFLTARVQLGLQAEHPRLVAQLLEAICPNFLAPIPSMMIARLEAAIDSIDPRTGAAVPRGSTLVHEARRGQAGACEFVTAQDLTVWPLAVESVRAFTVAPDLPLNRLPLAGDVRGGLRIGLRLRQGASWDQLGATRLRFHFSGLDTTCWRIFDLVRGAALGSWLISDTDRSPSRVRDAGSVRTAGLEAEEALLPDTERSFSGPRLIQEFAVLPHRVLFMDVDDLADRWRGLTGDRVELVLLFSRSDAALEPLVDERSVALNCTPAINLVKRTLNRVEAARGQWEYHAVPDRARPLDFEVHHLDEVLGFARGGGQPRQFLPLYATRQDRMRDDAGYFTTRRVPRLLSEREREQGPRSSYVGDEVYVSLVDGRHGPLRDEIQQLRISAWVTQRDLPLLTATASSAWRLDVPGPVRFGEVLRGPTGPISRRAAGDPGWRLLGHLTQNHLDLADGDPQLAAQALRLQLALYGPPADAAWQRQVDGIRSLTVGSVVRRLPFAGPLTHGLGSDVRLELDEAAYPGTSAIAMAHVLEEWLARTAAINSFIALRLHTPQRGEVLRCAPRRGVRAML